MKKILLLGGNGYVGCRLYDYFKNLNYHVTNVDICWFGKIYEDTLEINYDNLSKKFINQFSHIILLAAHSSVAMCGDSLKSCFQNNVVNFLNLIEKLKEDQVLLYASSAAVYGNNSNLVDESFPLKGGITYYDYTKICNDNIANLYPNKKIIGLRFGSVGGFSKNFRNESLMNAVITSAKFNNKIIVTNPENYRSVLGINDLCRAIDAVIQNDIVKNKVYNITSINSKIIEVAQCVKDITNCDIQIKDTITTNYSFNCSNELFQKDYSFIFQDTIASIYYDVIGNYDKITNNVKREIR